MGSLSLNSRFDGHPRQNLLHPFIDRYNPQTLRILPVFLKIRVWTNGSNERFATTFLNKASLTTWRQSWIVSRLCHKTLLDNALQF